MDIMEKEIEKELVCKLRAKGHFCLKFVSPQNAGVPDRVVLCKGGKAFFVEVKQKHGRLSPLQKAWHAKLNAQGFLTLVIYGKDDIDSVLKVADSYASREGEDL